jgi:hypothetical protein
LAVPVACAHCLSNALRLCKLSCRKDISDESVAMAAQVLLDKWSARGCDPKVLATIHKDVFNIGEPKKQRGAQDPAEFPAPPPRPEHNHV